MDYDHALLRAELTRDEGRRTHPYLDSKGILTVGVGHNLRDNGIPHEVLPLLGLAPDSDDLSAPFRPGYEWPATAIDALLDHDIAAAERGLDGLLPDWRAMDDVRQRVCLNMCFNMGADRLAGFRATLNAIRAGDWAAAAAEMADSAWHRELPVRSARLIAMMESGQTAA